MSVPVGSSDQNVSNLKHTMTICCVPRDTSESFMLIQPFTPNNKANMIAWMVGKSDGADYGKVAVIRYPKQKFVTVLTR